METKTSLQAFPEISSEQWEQLRQTFLENGNRARKRDLTHKLAVGYFSEAYYPWDNISWRMIDVQIQHECEKRAAEKIGEFWDALFEIYNVERHSEEGKYLTNTTLATVDAKRGKNCGGMSPETFWEIYVNFQDLIARMTHTGDYDPEVIAANEAAEDEDESW